MNKRIFSIHLFRILMIAMLVIPLALSAISSPAKASTDSTIIAWGYDGYGQSSVPAGLTDVTAFAAGGNHSLALKANGTVVAWGYNYYGQITVPYGLSDVIAIAAGFAHSLALKADGTVVGWGYDPNVPVGISGVTAIAAGYGHSLALKTNGTIAAWGDNTYGQINIPAGLSGVIAIVAGDFHSLALKADGTVVSWGDNAFGQSSVPAGLTGVTAITASGAHSLALKADGTVVAWGGNTYGESSVPAGLSGVTAIAAGGLHSLALKADGAVVAWGYNGSGQSSVPDGLTGVTAIAAGGLHSLALKAESPVVAWGCGYPFTGGQCTVPLELSGVTAVAGGVFHSLALKSDGTVIGWGSNSLDQLNIPSGLSSVVAVDAGQYHSLALKSDGTVVAWGNNNHGQSTVPADLTSVKAISAGDEHSLALKSDGTVVGWGESTYGQITIPSGLTSVIAIAAGGRHSMALKNDGTVVAWGNNSKGQLNIPFGLSGVVAVAAGQEHNLALKSDGTVIAWGNNDHGQATIPAGLSNVTAVASGIWHNLALKSNGIIVAWGDNSFSQLNTPTGLTDVTLISSGGHHNLALGSLNHAPMAINDAYLMDENTTLSIAAPGVLSNDTDMDNDLLTAILVTGPVHGTLGLNADGSFTYTPAANYTGLDSFTYKADDGTLGSNTATVSITVNAVNYVPVAVNDAYSINEDTALQVTAPGMLTNDTDADGEPLTTILISDPAHGTLVLNTNGSFTYTPAANYAGPDSFTYKANDGVVDSNVATVSITVNAVNDAPMTVNDAYSTDEDTILTIAAPAGVLSNDTDVEGDPLTVVLVKVPVRGILVLNVDGSFTYTPEVNQTGLDSFTYMANDGTLDSAIATVSITINPVNDDPAVDDDSYSTNEDTALTIAAPGVLSNDMDTDSDLLTAVLVSPPAQGALTLNANGSFNYVPAVGYTGIDSFTYKVFDGALYSNIGTVYITVKHVNHAPVAGDDVYSSKEDADLIVTPSSGILLNDTDGDSDSLTAIQVTDPQHGRLTLVADGSFTYTPEDSYFGSDSFTYKANDGLQDSNIAIVTINIDPVNDAPVALNQSVATDEGTALSITLNATDAENDQLTYMIVDAPTHGALSGTVPELSYSPNVGYSGPDSFTFKANDGAEDSNVATVSISVNAVNDAPVAVNDSYSTDEDIMLSIATPGVLLNDTDADGDPLTATLISGPEHGTLILNADGSFTFTPAANYAGLDSFTYKANDGTLDSTAANVSITVNEVNDDAVAVDDTYSADEDITLTITAPGVLSNDLDIEGNLLTAVLVSGPVHGALTLNADGSFTYTPAADYSGSDSFIYKAYDGMADSNVAAVSITVDPVNDAPVSQDQSVATNEGLPLEIILVATDAENYSLIYTIVFEPANGTLSGIAPNITYTPNNGYAGPDSFTYKANDGELDSNVATVSITVGQTNIAPTANPGGPYLGAVNTAISFDGSLSSDPENDPLTYAWTFGDGTTGTGATPTHAYTVAGIYTICLTVNDGTVDSDPACTLAVVYDPSAGFVTGSGWINSPAGAYTADPNLTGQATFGFISKYKKGDPVPTGTTQFQFSVAGLSFYSEIYEWLVVNQSGTNAQFKGSGLINGTGDPNGNAYKFMLWATDESPDTFRIRIWWEDATGEHDVYDNGVTQAIGAGNIVVHTKK